MRPDAYIPLYLSDFFQAVEGYRDNVGMGYLRALWHYWKHTHCEGLDNDPDYLQRVTRCESSDWARTFPIIFGHFFTLDTAGKWQQKRAKELWDQADKNYQSILDRSRRGVQARQESLPGLEPQVDPQVKPGDKPHVNQSESESESESKQESKPVVGANKSRPATCDQIWMAVLQTSSAYAGIDVKAEHAKMILWCENKKKNPTRSRFLAWLNRIERPMQSTTGSGTGPTAPGTAANLTIASKELDRVNTAIERIRSSAARDPFGALTSSKDKQQLRTLKDRRTQLMTTLNVQV